MKLGCSFNYLCYDFPEEPFLPEGSFQKGGGVCAQNGVRRLRGSHTLGLFQDLNFHDICSSPPCFLHISPQTGTTRILVGASRTGGDTGGNVEMVRGEPTVGSGLGLVCQIHEGRTNWENKEKVVQWGNHASPPSLQLLEASLPHATFASKKECIPQSVCVCVLDRACHQTWSLLSQLE